VGTQPSHLQEGDLIRAAEEVWDVFAAGSSTAAAAQRMLHSICQTPSGSASRLGRTAWNAYSFNIDYRTGAHGTIHCHAFVLCQMRHFQQIKSSDMGNACNCLQCNSVVGTRFLLGVRVLGACAQCVVAQDGLMRPFNIAALHSCCLLSANESITQVCPIWSCHWSGPVQAPCHVWVLTHSAV